MFRESFQGSIKRLGPGYVLRRPCWLLWHSSSGPAVAAHRGPGPGMGTLNTSDIDIDIVRSHHKWAFSADNYTLSKVSWAQLVRSQPRQPPAHTGVWHATTVFGSPGACCLVIHGNNTNWDSGTSFSLSYQNCSLSIKDIWQWHCNVWWSHLVEHPRPGALIVFVDNWEQLSSNNKKLYLPPPTGCSHQGLKIQNIVFIFITTWTLDSINYIEYFDTDHQWKCRGNTVAK